MGAVPRPPAGLADRIKADIPKYLNAHPAPERFSWATTMRVAASILLLLTTALVTRQLLEPRLEKTEQRAAAEQVTPAVLRYEDPPRASDGVTTTRETELQLDVAEEAPRMLPTAATAAPQARVASGGAPAVETARRLGGEEGAETGRFAERKELAQQNSEPLQIAEAMPAPPPSAPAPAPVAPPPPPSAEAAATNAAGAQYTYNAPSLVAEARADSLQLQPGSVFGISVDPNAFPALRAAIENGARPAPGLVNIEALVNYFAGAKAPRRDVALEVEASPAPVAAEGDRAILRFTIDTANVDVPRRGSNPPVARDAHLHIEIDPKAVATFRRIGEGNPEESETALLHNTSVTGLYELSLKPKLRGSQRVATVTLRYVSVKTGRKQSVSRVIHGHDLAKTWEKASRRHRLAALGAIWSETLKGTNGGPEIIRRAEELATQNPRDSRARELANAASASIGGGR
ncbi:MAG TPA: von Willebrand factor type A domain-containing protein [Thermoanaerobaculia bacterium]|jgi:hypothetical protein